MITVPTIIKKGLFLLLIMVTLLFSSYSVIATKPAQQTVESTQILQIEVPKSDNLIINHPYKFHVHVFNGTGALMTNASVRCMFHLYNISGSHIIENYMGFDSNNNDFNYTIAEPLFSQTGIYSYIVQCNNSIYHGFYGDSFTVIRRELTVEFSDTEVIKQERNYTVTVKVYDASQKIRDNTSTNCLLDFYNVTGENILHVNMSFDTVTRTDFHYTINKEKIITKGNYLYEINCNSTGGAGNVKGYYKVTSDGLNDDNQNSDALKGIILILGVLSIPILLLFFASQIEKNSFDEDGALIPNRWNYILRLIAFFFTVASLPIITYTLIKLTSNTYFSNVALITHKVVMGFEIVFGVFLLLYLSTFMLNKLGETVTNRGDSWKKNKGGDKER